MYSCLRVIRGIPAPPPLAIHRNIHREIPTPSLETSRCARGARIRAGRRALGEAKEREPEDRRGHDERGEDDGRRGAADDVAHDAGGELRQRHHDVEHRVVDAEGGGQALGSHCFGQERHHGAGRRPGQEAEQGERQERVREDGKQQRGEPRGDAAGDDDQGRPAEAVREHAAEGHRENRDPDRQAHDEAGVAERDAAGHQHRGAEGDDGDEARVEAAPGEARAQREPDLSPWKPRAARRWPGRVPLRARRIAIREGDQHEPEGGGDRRGRDGHPPRGGGGDAAERRRREAEADRPARDRKSTRLNSSHSQISYAVFCLKKKKTNYEQYAPATSNYRVLAQPAAHPTLRYSDAPPPPPPPTPFPSALPYTLISPRSRAPTL